MEGKKEKDAFHKRLGDETTRILEKANLDFGKPDDLI